MDFILLSLITYCLQLKHPFTQMFIKEQYISAAVPGAAYRMTIKTDMAPALLGLIVHWYGLLTVWGT